MSYPVPTVGEHAAACEHPDAERIPILRHGQPTGTLRCAACGALLQVRDGGVVVQDINGL